MSHRERDRTLLLILESLVLAIVILSVVLFGGKSELYASLLNVLSVPLLGLTILLRVRRGAPRPISRQHHVYHEPWLAYGLLALFALVHLAQLIPLPSMMVRLLAGWHPDGSWARLTPYPEATLRAFLSWFPPFAVFAAVTTLFHTRHQVQRLTGGLFILAAAVSLYGIVETISGREAIWTLTKLAYRGSVTGTFINRNNFAAFAALGLGAGLGLSLYQVWKAGGTPKPEGSVERLVLSAFLAVISLLGILLSRSRGGLAGLLLAGLPTAYWLAGKRNQKALSILVVVMVVASIGMGLWISQEPLTQRFASLPDEAGAVDSRPAAWWTSLRIAARGPLLGVGAGTYGDQFRVTPDTGVMVRYNHAHSDPLEFLAETGLVGLLTLYGAIFWTLWAAWRGFGERHSRFSRALTIGAMAGLAAVLLHGLFDFPLQIPGVRIPFFALLGLAYVAANRRLIR